MVEAAEVQDLVATTYRERTGGVEKDVDGECGKKRTSTAE